MESPIRRRADCRDGIHTHHAVYPDRYYPACPIQQPWYHEAYANDSGNHRRAHLRGAHARYKWPDPEHTDRDPPPRHQLRERPRRHVETSAAGVVPAAAPSRQGDHRPPPRPPTAVPRAVVEPVPDPHKHGDSTPSDVKSGRTPIESMQQRLTAMEQRLTEAIKSVQSDVGAIRVRLDSHDAALDKLNITRFPPPTPRAFDTAHSGQCSGGRTIQAPGQQPLQEEDTSDRDVVLGKDLHEVGRSSLAHLVSTVVASPGAEALCTPTTAEPNLGGEALRPDGAAPTHAVDAADCGDSLTMTETTTTCITKAPTSCSPKCLFAPFKAFRMSYVGRNSKPPPRTESVGSIIEQPPWPPPQAGTASWLLKNNSVILVIELRHSPDPRDSQSSASVLSDGAVHANSCSSAISLAFMPCAGTSQALHLKPHWLLNAQYALYVANTPTIPLPVLTKYSVFHMPCRGSVIEQCLVSPGARKGIKNHVLIIDSVRGTTTMQSTMQLLTIPMLRRIVGTAELNGGDTWLIRCVKLRSEFTTVSVSFCSNNGDVLQYQDSSFQLVQDVIQLLDHVLALCTHSVSEYNCLRESFKLWDPGLQLVILPGEAANVKLREYNFQAINHVFRATKHDPRKANYWVEVQLITCARNCCFESLLVHILASEQSVHLLLVMTQLPCDSVLVVLFKNSAEQFCKGSRIEAHQRCSGRLSIMLLLILQLLYYGCCSRGSPNNVVPCFYGYHAIQAHGISCICYMNINGRAALPRNFHMQFFDGLDLLLSCAMRCLLIHIIGWHVHYMPDFSSTEFSCGSKAENSAVSAMIHLFSSTCSGLEHVIGEFGSTLPFQFYMSERHGIPGGGPLNFDLDVIALCNDNYAGKLAAIGYITSAGMLIGFSIQTDDISILQLVIPAGEFPASHTRQFLLWELPQIVATSVGLPCWQWDQKHAWPPPLSLDALALGLQSPSYASSELHQSCLPSNQLYGKSNKCSVLEQKMSVMLLNAGGSNIVRSSFVHHETLNCKRDIDKFQRHMIDVLHWKKPWPSWKIFFYDHQWQYYGQWGSATWFVQNQYITECSTGRVVSEDFQWAIAWLPVEIICSHMVIGHLIRNMVVFVLYIRNSVHLLFSLPANICVSVNQYTEVNSADVVSSDHEKEVCPAECSIALVVMINTFAIAAIVSDSFWLVVTLPLSASYPMPYVFVLGSTQLMQGAVQRLWDLAGCFVCPRQLKIINFLANEWLNDNSALSFSWVIAWLLWKGSYSVFMGT